MLNDSQGFQHASPATVVLQNDASAIFVVNENRNYTFWLLQISHCIGLSSPESQTQFCEGCGIPHIQAMFHHTVYHNTVSCHMTHLCLSSNNSLENDDYTFWIVCTLWDWYFKSATSLCHLANCILVGQSLYVQFTFLFPSLLLWKWVWLVRLQVAIDQSHLFFFKFACTIHGFCY